jgi:transposase
MPRDGRTLPHNILEEMRFRAIEAHQAGKGVAEIAKLLGLHWGSVSRWLTKWRRDGQRALKERKATGRPPKLDCKRHGKAILELVKHPATEYGYEHPLWTCQRIRQVISAELNLVVSVPTLWRELKKLKLSCQKPERRALEQDPKARARWIATEWPRIKRLARKQRALLFFEDESVVRLTPTVGRTWAPVGKTPIVRVTGKRASVLVMSALSVQGRLFFKIPSERVNATVFIDFLKELLAEYPKRKIFVIADQASPHIAKSVKAFAAGQKRLELFYLPAYSPDFNPDEGVWSHLKSQELKAHQATNKEELIKKTHEALKRMAKRPVLIRSFFKRCNIT